MKFVRLGIVELFHYIMSIEVKISMRTVDNYESTRVDGGIVFSSSSV